MIKHIYNFVRLDAFHDFIFLQIYGQEYLCLPFPFYSSVLLVFISYKPKTHDLKDLSKQVASQDPSFLSVFPLGTAEERLFELLRKAYVDARYDKNYKITHEELQWLGERLSLLQKMTEEICMKKIDSFAN